MALTKTVTGAVNQIMAMDGTAAILEAIHTATAFTMAGTATTGALLGATAPNIGAGKYTQCLIPSATIGQTAGMAFSLMVVVNTAWAGDDATLHYFYDNRGTDSTHNRILIYKVTTNFLQFYVYNNAAAYKRCSQAVSSATNWAAGVHNIIVTRTAAGVQDAYLDGTQFSVVNNGAGTGLETVVAANTYIGSAYDLAYPVEGTILSAMWNRVLTAGEIAALSAAAAWANVIDLPQITVNGLNTGNAVRLYDSAGNIHASAVEAGGTATLTYTLD